MVLAERETLNLALEALREKLVLPEETVILKEDNAYRNYDAIVQIMNVVKDPGCNRKKVCIVNRQIHNADCRN